MATNSKLENYLTSLEKELKSLSVSDRAELITKIKNDVMSSLERDPNVQIDSILEALGKPKTVANRYLVERGLKLTLSPVGLIVKWLVIGFLGTFTISIISVIFLLTKLSPLLQINEKTGHVSFFGGLIDINENFFTQVASSHGNALRGEQSFSGFWKIKGQGSKNLVIEFNKGTIELTNAKNDSALSWTCITTNQVPSLMLPQEKNKQMTLDLSQLASVKCQVSVPENFKLFVQGAHGKIESKEPHYDLNAQLSEGEINLSPDAKHQYRYNLFVARGTSDTFTSSKEASAHEMSISIQNGKITHSP